MSSGKRSKKSKLILMSVTAVFIAGILNRARAGSNATNPNNSDYELQQFPDGMLSKYFSLDEFMRSSTAYQQGIDNSPTDEALMAGMMLAQFTLDPAREVIGGPIYVNSWYRSPELNQWMVDNPNFPAAANSYHMTGGAADVRYMLNGEKRNDLLVGAILAANVPFRRLLIEKGTLERPSWIQLEYDGSKLPSQQDGKILVIPAGSGTSGYPLTLEEAKEIYPAP